MPTTVISSFTTFTMGSYISSCQHPPYTYLAPFLFIFVLPRYIPLYTLRLDEGVVHGRIYQATQLSAALRIPAPMLSVYAVLCGCDHVDSEITTLVRTMARKRAPRLPYQGNLAVAALLPKFTTSAEAVKGIAQLLPRQDENRAKEQWTQAIKGYHVTELELELEGGIEKLGRLYFISR